MDLSSFFAVNRQRPMSESFRIESDSLGEMKVPVDALYGAQTARAIENFPISGWRFSRTFLRALGLIKKHAAQVNAALGLLDSEIAVAVARASAEVVDGRWDGQFVVDIFQTGSGTSTNMNANEVIANRAAELLGADRGEKRVHPNDHVNCGQSSNDVIPSALHLAALLDLTEGLIPALRELEAALQGKSRDFCEIIKIGRTHLQDATPVRLGQVFGGFAAQVDHGLERLRLSMEHLEELALGGTAVGTGLNTHPEFAARVIQALARETGLPLREAANHFEAQGARDACVAVSGALKTVAVSLIKIANDIRFLGSGPRCGYGELILPELQPGSSIMPGKVNPVLCEMVMQVGAQVVGQDATVTFAGAFGNFELNVMMPVLAYNLLHSISLLAAASRSFARDCLHGLQVNEEVCRSEVERSLAMVTALVPEIGYDRAAAIAKKAFAQGRTIREVAAEESGLTAQKVEELLDPARQTGA